METAHSTLPQHDTEALKVFLLQHVREHYQHVTGDLLLANLGWAVNKQHPELRAVLGRQKVGQFIKLHMGDALEVLPDPENPTVVYVYLKGETPPAPATAQSVASYPAGSIKARKYAHAVVLAFARPIASGFKRFLVLSDNSIYYRDLIEGSETPSDGFEIDSKLIVQTRAESVDADAPSTLDERIDQWLSMHGLPVARVLEQPIVALAKKARHGSLLDQLLASLTDVERKRVQLPLDIVAKLQNTRK